MSRKSIDAAREVRLWIRDIIVPIGVGIGTIFAVSPDAREAAKEKYESIKDKFQKK